MARLDTNSPLRQPPPVRPRDAITAEIEDEARARTLALRDAFEALYAEWLRNRADSIAGFGGSDIPRAHSDREDELARLITTTPAPLPWMIFQKLRVLEHYLAEDGTNWTDNRELVMLAGIQADLLRFGIEAPRS
ncbi:MAG: hypothetical protein PGN34_07570 [Methylobacterium frigidaeris]